MYHTLDSHIITINHIINWINWFGIRCCQTWRGIYRKLNIIRRLHNTHIFVCHSSTICTWWLIWSERVCGGQTHLVFFTPFYHYFRLNLYNKTSLWNEVELKVTVHKETPLHKKKQRLKVFNNKVIWIVGAAGVTVPVIFMAKGTLLQPRTRCINLVTW